MEIEKRINLILEAANYCKSVQRKEMPKSAYSKALREPIHFLWEKRNGSKKEDAATYRSINARGLSFGDNKLRYDHAIPYKYAMNEILDCKNLDSEKLKHILESKIFACLITIEEDDLLNKAGYRSKMPKDWNGQDPLARYNAVGIKVELNA